MKTARFVRGVIAFAGDLGHVSAQVAFAVEPTPAPAVVDVALGDGGVLHGQVVDLQGRAWRASPSP